MQYIKNKNGITLILLIVTVIIMAILATVTITFSKKGVDKARLEDIKIDMLLLQGKSKTIYERYTFKEIDKLTGIEYNPANSNTTSYVINQELKNILKTKTDGVFYIWEQKDLEENGIGTIKITSTQFYIVDYASGEVYYSSGCTKDGKTYYSLTEIQGL